MGTILNMMWCFLPRYNSSPGVDSSSVGLTLYMWIISSSNQVSVSLGKHSPPISLSLAPSCFLFFPFSTSCFSLSAFCRRAEAVVIRYRDCTQLVGMSIVKTPRGGVGFCYLASFPEEELKRTGPYCHLVTSLPSTLSEKAVIIEKSRMS